MLLSLCIDILLIIDTNYVGEKKDVAKNHP